MPDSFQNRFLEAMKLRHMKQKDVDSVSLQLAAKEILDNHNYKNRLQEFQIKSQIAGGNAEIAKQILTELDN